MSLAFSDTTNKNGIIQAIERNLYGDDGDGKISGNTIRLKRFTADINLALDKVWAIILEVSGTWNFDDNNHGDYPIIRAPIVSGQRDYQLTTDGSGNTVLEIFKVFCRISATGQYQELDPVDVQSSRKFQTDNFTDGLNTTGIPDRYDKTGNSIFLDAIPNFDSDDGLMAYVSREGFYFTTSDTTRKPGFSGSFHEFLALEPAYKHASRNGFTNAAAIGKDMEIMEQKLRAFYGRRAKDEKHVFRPRITPFR